MAKSPPPAEISDLVAQTVGAARAVQPLADAYSKATCPGADCDAAFPPLFAELSSLKHTLEQWGPYV